MYCKLLTDLILQNFERQYSLSSNELLKSCAWSDLSLNLDSTQHHWKGLIVMREMQSVKRKRAQKSSET